jgi:hypothetical protein
MGSLFKNIGDRLAHPFWAALGGSIVPTIISIYLVYATITNTNKLQEDQNKRDLVNQFVKSSNQIVDVGSQFISAMNDTKDLSGVTKVVSSFAGQQMLEVENLKQSVPSDVSFADYEKALQEFSDTAQNTKSALDVKAWSESFGHVVDTKEAPTNSLRKRLGVSARL